MANVDLGPFTLDEPLGAGGMGMVWRALHRRSGKPVAIKCLLSSGKSSPELLTGFRREVQMVARLDHPNVVRVLDYGTVPDGIDQRALHPGDPWLAMELASQGSLKEATVFGWSQLRWVLASTLDGLAHAHARGVVHRDLKPGNLLLTQTGAERTLKLADFGIAHLRRAATGETDIRTDQAHSAGTPRYMAPEQLVGEFRDFGPWTDLYALGCIAFRLATGRHVFSGSTIFELADKHVHREPPPVRARFPVPDGFVAWVHRLLAKSPRDRFQRAADAAWVLRELPAPTARVTSGEEMSFDEFDDTVSDLGFVPEVAPQAATLTLDLEDTAPLEELVDATDPGIRGALELVAPIPAHWRDGRRLHAELNLFDAGLGLFGMRDVPIVGREQQRSRLWEALREVRNDGKPRVVQVLGRAGSGKSRLARWLVERAHEVGGAVVIRAFHDREPTPGSGLIAAVTRWTECEGLDREQTWQRLRVMLTGRHRAPSDLAARMTQLLVPSSDETDDDVPAVRFSGPTERWTVLRDGLAALAGGRPVVLWVDDAQWAGRTLEAVDVLTGGAGALTALVVMTVRSEALQKRPGERALLEAFDERSTKLELEALAGDERRQLVNAMLPLAPAIARDIASRTEGYPLFVAQLLADWVERGALTEGPRGFEPRPGESMHLPDDIRTLWRERLDALKLAFGAGAAEATRALQVAAVLGRDVDPDEWRAVCRELGFEPPPGLLEVMIQRGLATSRRNGWSFVHGLLAETVSAETDERPAIHAASATVVARGAGTPDRELRIARHLLASGNAEGAIDPALRAVDLAWSTDQLAVREALRIADEGVGATGPDDPRALQVQLWKVRRLRTEWKFDETKELARDLETRADSAGLDSFRAEAHVELGLARAYEEGDLPRGLPDLVAAATLFKQEGETSRRAEVLSRMSYIYSHDGNVDEALRASEEALAVFRSGDDPGDLARGLVAVANARRASEDIEGSQEALREAVDVAREAGLRYWQANALYGLAKEDSHSGEYERSIERFRESARICEEIGSTAVDAARIELACVFVLDEQWDAARSILSEIEARGTLAQLEARARLPSLVLAARADDWEGANGYMDGLEEDVTPADPTTQSLLDIAADACNEAPPDLTRRIQELKS